MIKNVGGKIKIAAVIMLVILIIGSVLGGLYVGFLAYIFMGDGVSTTVFSLLIGCFSMAGAVFVSCLIFLLIYGFGQIVENSDKAVENAQQIEQLRTALMNAGHMAHEKQSNDETSTAKEENCGI